VFSSLRVGPWRRDAHNAQNGVIVRFRQLSPTRATWVKALRTFGLIK
jgi:hypothetical protein